MKVVLPLVLLITFQVQCNVMCLSEHGLDLQKSADQTMGDVAHHHHHSEPDQDNSHHSEGTDCKHPSFDNAESVQFFRLVHVVPHVDALVLPDFAVTIFDSEPSHVATDLHSPPETTGTRILSLRI